MSQKADIVWHETEIPFLLKIWRSCFYTKKRRSYKICKTNTKRKQQFGSCLLSVFVSFNDSKLIRVIFLPVCVHQPTIGSDSMLLLISYTALKRLEEEKGESKGAFLEHSKIAYAWTTNFPGSGILGRLKVFPNLNLPQGMLGVFVISEGI